MNKPYDVFNIKIGEYETSYVYYEDKKFFFVKEFFSDILGITVLSTYLRNRGFDRAVPLLSVRFIDGTEKKIFTVSEPRLKYVLKRYENKNLTEEQAERLNKACTHFGIKRKVFIPKMKIEVESFDTNKIDDLWGQLCYFVYRKKNPPFVLWKKCPICDKKLPYNPIFYNRINMVSTTYSEICLKCLGKDYICDNEFVNKCKNFESDEVLQYILKDQPINIYKFIKDRNSRIKIDLDLFSDLSIIKFLKYLEKNDFFESFENYKSKLYTIIQRPKKQVLDIINNQKENIRFGKDIHISIEQLTREVKKMFPVYISWKVAEKNNITCICGFLHNGNSYFIVKNKIKGKSYRQIEFVRDRNKMLKILKKIRGDDKCEEKEK